MECKIPMSTIMKNKICCRLSAKMRLLSIIPENVVHKLAVYLKIMDLNVFTF